MTISINIKHIQMQKNYLLALFSLLLSGLPLKAQDVSVDTTQGVTLAKEYKVKKGYNVGLLPAIGYNSDTGFKYGLLANIFNYGDGSNYPNYNESLYLEWSRTTKGNGINRITYDTRTLIPRTRMIADVSYITERALDFFGFNGYQGYYNANFINEKQSNYISRMYYAHGRKALRITADFQGTSEGSNLHWLGGIAYFNTKISTVDVALLNKGKTDNLLPDTALLYDKYVAWGVIPTEEAIGGQVLYLKGGAVYDTRNRESNPSQGVWSEASLLGAIGVGSTKASYARLHVSHRQYIPLVHKRLTLAYRLSYQSILLGNTPFYMLPYSIDSYSISDGVGSNKTVRGVLRNRIVGEGFAYGNLELRSTIFSTILFNQNFDFGLNAFADAGMVTKPYEFNTSGIPADQLQTVQFEKEKLHVSLGMGIRIAMNSNFVVAVDYGKALNPQDGTSGLYIGLGYLF